jgi:integrase
MKKRGSGEGSIYQMTDGRWRAALSLGWKNGKRCRKIITAATRKEVQDQLTVTLRARQLGLPVAPERQSVEQFLTYWLAEVIPGSTKPKTETFYRYIVTTHLIPAIGKIQIQKLGPQHVQTLINGKLDTAKMPRAKKPAESAEREPEPPLAKLSARSVRHIHRTLCTALETAMKYGIVERNVAALVVPPRVPKGQMKFLSVDQARAVLAAAADEPLYALYATILSLGLRLGEALGLSWDDVDFSKGRIKVWRALQRVDGVMTLLEPKTEGSHRKIDLPAVTIAALREHRIRQEHAREWAGSGWAGNAWNLVFTTGKGTPLDERGVLRRFQDRILKNAGVPKMRIHDLRHSAVAILMAQGVDARSIAELLGHSSVAFTLQVYGHLMEETKRETASKMDHALSPVATSLATKTASRPI